VTRSIPAEYTRTEPDSDFLVVGLILGCVLVCVIGGLIMTGVLYHKNYAKGGQNFMVDEERPAVKPNRGASSQRPFVKS